VNVHGEIAWSNKLHTSNLTFAINVYESFLHHKGYILRIDKGEHCPIATVNRMRFLQLHAKSFNIQKPERDTSHPDAKPACIGNGKWQLM